MQHKTLKCSKLASILYKKCILEKKKTEKTVKNIQLSYKCNKFEFFAFFSIKNGLFCENEASSEHLNVSRRIFFVSEVFRNFQVKFSNHIGGGHFENIDLAININLIKFSINTNIYINNPSNISMIH